MYLKLESLQKNKMEILTNQTDLKAVSTSFLMVKQFNPMYLRSITTYLYHEIPRTKQPFYVVLFLFSFRTNSSTAVGDTWKTQQCGNMDSMI